MPETGKFSDMEWKRTLVVCVLIGQVFIAFAIIPYWGIAKPIAHATAPDPQTSILPPAYGFWVRGNASFFMPGVMNRTDVNTSSPTYMSWTPPPEWRDFCIASSGMPLSACSYFMYDEFPTFMLVFYIVMFVLELFISCFKARFVFLSLKAIKHCCASGYRRDGPSVFRAWFTPWGIDKSPDVSSICLTFQAQAVFHWTTQAALVLTLYFTAFAEPGFGLVNSFHTGKLYFGALWNHFPLPTCAPPQKPRSRRSHPHNLDQHLDQQQPARAI